MPCPECARLRARIDDLCRLYSRTSAQHLKASQLSNSADARRREEMMFSCYEAILQAKRRLAKHRLTCAG